MKNLYTWILAVMVCFGIMPMAAQDSGEQEIQKIQFTVNVANPEVLKCEYRSEPYELVEGANEFDVPVYSSVRFIAQSPWMIKSVTNKEGSSMLYSSTLTKEWSLYVQENVQDEAYSIELVNLDDLRTAQFTLNVDDPTLVAAQLTGYYTDLKLEAGENIIKYQPNVETNLNLRSADYSVPLYSVKKNGVEVAATYGSYSVPLSPDCVIDVVATLPDEDCTVSFSYSEGAENSISVKVNNEDVTDFDGKVLVVKLGSKVTITGNSSEYKFESVKIDGMPVSFYGQYEFSVMKNSSVEIEARPYGKISATISVSNPELLTVTSNGETLDLQKGDNLIELPENQTNISWSVSSLGILKEVSVNGNPLSSYQTYYALSDGDKMVFDIEEKVFDLEAIVWVDNVKGKACNNYLGFDSPNDRGVRYELENGYNFVDFYEAMNPFSLSWNGYSEEDPQIGLTGKVYLNDQLLSPDYEGNTSYSLTLAEGDVLKLFMDTDPVKCDVSFDIAEGVNVEVVKDVISAVENPSAGFECFAGTQVKISGSDIKVEVNGVEIKADDASADENPGEEAGEEAGGEVATQADEEAGDDASGEVAEGNDGVLEFVFVVENPETNVVVKTAGGSAVNAVEVIGTGVSYDILGRRVAPETPGLQIRNGKKVFVKP